MQPFSLQPLYHAGARKLALYDGPMSHRIYFWRVQDRNGRWYQTRFRATEEHIRKEHREAERIDSDAIGGSARRLVQGHAFSPAPRR